MAPKAKEAPKAAPKAKADAKAKAEPKKKKEEKPEEDDKPKVPQPDKAAMEEKVAAIQSQIEALTKEQAGYSQKISERSAGKEEFFQKKSQLRAKLDEYSGKLNELQERKEGIKKQVDDQQQAGREMRQQLNKMKKSIGFSDETEIDNRIATIEFKLWTDTMPLKEEKKLLQEIQELKRNRPKVSQVKGMETNLENHDAGLSMKEKVGGINEEMAKWRELKRGISEQLTALTEERKSQMGDLPTIIAERDEISKKIKDLSGQRNEVREAFRAQEREYNAYLYEQRKARQEKAQEERQKRQAEWEQRQKVKRAEKLDDQPHVQEITLIEQTMLFCRSLTQTKATEKEDEKKETIYEKEGPDGLQVLSKKEDRDEYYFAPTKKKGKASKKTEKASSGKAIKHNAETFRLFDQLKLDAPITTDEIPGLLEKLEAQLADYKEKVKKWEEDREEMKKKILEGTFVEEEAKKEEAEDSKEEAAEEGDKTEEAA